MNDFSMESILFKNIVPSSNISNIKTSKSIDECVYDAYKSEEELKFYETYTMINDYNTKQKLRMLNKLRNTTNRIHNTNINNSCESYIRSIEENEIEDSELKISGFTVRIWEAIKTFCRRIIDAIVNLIKYIGNFISGIGNKKQEKDYQFYIKNQGKINIGEIDEAEADNHGFTISYGDINKFLNKVCESYGAFVKNTFDGIDVKVIAEAEDKMAAALQWAKNIDLDKLKLYYENIKNPNVKEFAENIFLEDIKKIFDRIEVDGNKPDVKKALEEVFYGQTKGEGKTTCGNIRKMSGNFECLSNNSGIIQRSKKLLETIKKQQQSFTTLTKQINKLTNKMIKEYKTAFKDEVKDAPKDTDTKKNIKDSKKIAIQMYHGIQNALATITNGRIRYNSKWTSLGLSVESMCLKYNKMVYSVLKQYISGKTNNVDDSNNDENDNGGGGNRKLISYDGK